MPAKSTDDLFNLVHSLSDREKTKFRQMLQDRGIGKESNELRLFTAIVRQTEYNEQEIIQKLGGGKLRDYFSVVKNQLNESILVFMRSGMVEMSPRLAVQGIMCDIRFTCSRALYSQCEKLIRKAKKQARKYGLLGEYLELLYLEREVLLCRRSSKPEKDKSPDSIAKESDVVRGHLNDLYDYKDLYFRLYAFVSADIRSIPQEQKDEIDSLMNKPVMRNEEPVQAFEARQYFYQCHALYNRLNGRLHTSREFFDKLETLWQSNAHHLKFGVHQYIKVLANYAGLSYQLGEITDFQNALRKLESIKTRTPDEEAEQWQNVVHLQVLNWLHRADFENSKERSQDFRKKLSKYETKINPSRLLSIFYNLIVWNFLSGDFLAAQEYIEEMMCRKKSKVRTELLSFVGILELVTYYETGREELIPNNVRRDRYYLNMHSKNSDFEKLMLSFLVKLSNTPERERKELFESMKKTLVNLLRDGKQHVLIGSDEILYWLESRISKMPISQVFTERRNLEWFKLSNR